MKKFTFITLFIILISPKVFSEGNRNDYVKTYKNNLTLRPYLARNIYFFHIIPDEGFDKKMDYQPNVSWNMGVSISLWKITFSVSTELAKSDDIRTHGESKFLDLQLNYYGESFGFDIIFQKYKGFYLDNIEEFNRTWEADNDPNRVRSDLSTLNLVLNFYYIFNDFFSFSSAFKQTEKQLKSTGSFLLMAAVNLLFMDSDYSLIYPTEESNYDGLSGLRGGGFYTFSIAPGYAYYFVFGDFYFTPSLFIGTGIQYQSWHVTTGSKKYFAPWILKINIRIALGYNTDRFFAGTSGFLDMSKVHKKNIDIDSYTFNLSVFAGYRF